MHHLIDLHRYPLDRRDSPDWAALTAASRVALARDGMVDFGGFLRPKALDETVAVLEPRFERESFRHERSHNIYFRKSVEGLDPGHPALRLNQTVNHTLCADQMAGSALIALYDWPPFADFLAAIMGLEKLYPMADPLARVNVMEYRAGEALNWHFDRSEYTTTLLLQAPETGGLFEYATDLRSDDAPNYDGVARLLEGAVKPQVAHLVPGSLNVFRGRNTAHRVTPAGGARSRLIAVFSFYDRPGVTMTEEDRRGFYGRA